MSCIKRDMRPVILQNKSVTYSPSGQKKEEWINGKIIELAIYPVNGSVVLSNNVQFNQSTNTGLTSEKDIHETNKKNGNRIKDDSNIYTINFVNAAGRFTQLLLQKVI